MRKGSVTKDYFYSGESVAHLVFVEMVCYQSFIVNDRECYIEEFCTFTESFEMQFQMLRDALFYSNCLENTFFAGNGVYPYFWHAWPDLNGRPSSPQPDALSN